MINALPDIVRLISFFQLREFKVCYPGHIVRVEVLLKDSRSRIFQKNKSHFLTSGIQKVGKSSFFWSEVFISCLAELRLFNTPKVYNSLEPSCSLTYPFSNGVLFSIKLSSDFLVTCLDRKNDFGQ